MEFDVKAYGAVQDVRLLYVLEIINLTKRRSRTERARAKFNSVSHDYVA